MFSNVFVYYSCRCPRNRSPSKIPPLRLPLGRLEGFMNSKPNWRAYPSIYLIRLRDYGQDTIFVKGRWCINQESESCPSCSQHIVLLRYTYLWSFVNIFLTVQKLWPINNILPMTDNSTVKNQGLSYSTWSWWDISFRDLSVKLHTSIPSDCRVMALHS